MRDRRLQCDKLKFFLLYLLFFYITKQFIDSESGATIGDNSQFRIKKTEHVTWRSFVTHPLSPNVFEILAYKFIGVSTF